MLAVVLKCRLILLKGQWSLLQCLNASTGNSLLSEELFFKKHFADNTSYLENCSEWHMAMRINHVFLLDILRFKLKSNWNVDETLLTCYQQVTRKCKVISFKRQWTFKQFPVWKLIHFKKLVFEGDLCWLHMAQELLRFSFDLWIDHFVDWTITWFK